MIWVLFLCVMLVLKITKLDFKFCDFTKTIFITFKFKNIKVFTFQIRDITRKPQILLNGKKLEENKNIIILMLQKCFQSKHSSRFDSTKSTIIHKDSPKNEKNWSQVFDNVPKMIANIIKYVEFEDFVMFVGLGDAKDTALCVGVLNNFLAQYQSGAIENKVLVKNRLIMPNYDSERFDIDLKFKLAVKIGQFGQIARQAKRF